MNITEGFTPTLERPAWARPRSWLAGRCLGSVLVLLGLRLWVEAAGGSEG